ncbi:RNase HII [Anseongella ginsenosidimutans]|uniref:Ribonuclease HII n=1 Tax=Anseongella ginsenosidimutans TaxID=496056 RepID=A0A4R3KQY4_9SPHI|nr:ribonuclease HII [Anseongella ginsenosidimutans]QEC52214.1 ribonuclease HII [Anseongella ginsenosidimutans]TCS86763.1 RNase HII [Anseongella ginsenosidimutans]
MNKLLAYYKKDVVEAGCDEAGRGCLAGPVVAAAVVLPADFEHPLLNDSKQLPEDTRYLLREYILEHALAWAVGFAGHEEIDSINILNASFLAMHRAVEQLSCQVQHLIIDGNRFKKFREVPHQCIVKGDSLYYSIAAASVLAKTYRDDHMRELHSECPYYRWDSNKGYPTSAHRDAIRQFGLSAYHRRSFRLLPEQLEMEF